MSQQVLGRLTSLLTLLQHGSKSPVASLIHPSMSLFFPILYFALIELFYKAEYMITSLLSDPLTYLEGFLNNLPLTYFMSFFSDRATRKYLPFIPYLPLLQRFSARGQFHYPGDIWQCLEVFLIVKIWGATGI